MGISFACLLGDLMEAAWKKQLVYVFVLFLITSRLLNAVDLPLPLFRLYILLAAMGSLFLCMWWAVAARRRGDSPLYVWGFRLGAIFFAVVVIVELWGQAGLAEYLFNISIRTVLALLAGWLLIYLAHGGLDWAFQSSSLQRVTFLQSYTAAMVRRFKILADILIGLLVASSLLTTWRVYDSPVAAIKGLLSLAITVGSQRISVGLVLAAVSFVYGSFLISWAFRKLFVDQVLSKRHVDTGLRISIAGLIHYVLVTVGFLLALLALGFDLTSLTIIVSSLGIGIGFGLRSIVNDFISGLILLFERPVKVGDYIDIGGGWAVVKRIGIRSTTVQTFDQADVIVPNGDLITKQVTNWTHSDRSVRLIIPVRVAHGSDVTLVLETLINCATANAKVAKTPEPQVLFMHFGENSLDFELRVWVSDVNNMLELQSELHQEIDQRFRQLGIDLKR
jgi:small-conductance mechanosensitive channel